MARRERQWGRREWPRRSGGRAAEEEERDRSGPKAAHGIPLASYQLIVPCWLVSTCSSFPALNRNASMFFVRKAAGLRIHQIEPVVVDQHRLLFQPLGPALLADLGERPGPELSREGRALQPGARVAATGAMNVGHVWQPNRRKGCGAGVGDPLAHPLAYSTLASPKSCSIRMYIQPMSNSYHCAAKLGRLAGRRGGCCAAPRRRARWRSARCCGSRPSRRSCDSPARDRRR